MVAEKVKNSAKGIGFDVIKEEYVDMFKAGIVDPVKVTRSALQNAASISAMILTTESAVAEKPEKRILRQCLIWIINSKPPENPGGFIIL